MNRYIHMPLFCVPICLSLVGCGPTEEPTAKAQVQGRLIEQKPMTDGEATQTMWRRDIGVYCDDYIATIKGSTIPSRSELDASTRSITRFNDANGNALYILDGSAPRGTVQGELRAKFNGLVDWEGDVEEVNKDKSGKIESVVIKLPREEVTHQGHKMFLHGVKIFPVDTERFPDEYSKVKRVRFKGEITKDIESSSFEPVWIGYGQGANAGQCELGTTVGVKLSDVSIVIQK